MKTRLLFFLLIGLFSIGIPLTAQESADANEALALRYIEEVYNVNNTDIIDEILTPDFQFHTVGGDWSKTTLVGYIHDNHSPGMVETYLNPILVSEDNLVATLYTLDHDRVTFKAVTPGIMIMRMAEGRVGEIWFLEDLWYFRKSLVSKEADAVTTEWFPTPGTSDTTGAENRALAASALNIWQTGDVTQLSEVFADDLVFHLPAGLTTEPLNRDGLARYLTWLHSVMPDLQLLTEDEPVLSEGNVVVQALKFTGSLTPAQATRARSIKAQGMAVYRIVDGKIAEWWWHWQPQDPDGVPSSLFMMPLDYPVS